MHMARDMTKYNFNGLENLSKRQTVYELIKKYIQDNPEVTIEDLKKVFNSLHRGFEVCLSQSEYSEYIERTQTGKSRYFKEPIKLLDDQVYICNQWGAFFKNILQKASEIGFSIIPVTVESVAGGDNDESDLYISSPKNIILYGPPGVGKTYSHKKLISILENEDGLEELNNPDYKTVSFDSVKAEGRYQFLTFHQNYSYEDFIEGFRPNEEGKIVREDGLFKRICQKNHIEKQTNSESNEEMSFEELYMKLLERIEQQGEFKVQSTFNTILEFAGESYPKDKKQYFKVRAISSTEKTYFLAYTDLKRIFNAYNRNDTVLFKSLCKAIKIPESYLEKFIEVLKGANYSDKQSMAVKNYYLIIDEINRGNISKIFGELITLLEEDKRLGEPNELTVTLPYSKDLFGVPANLYIIGTMNTADKSIALVDIALRRRFTFVRMDPIDNYLSDNVKKINGIIKDRRGSDYLIGHAYFIDKDGSKIDESNPKYRFVMDYKIRPLLEEYFYGDDIDGIFDGLL